MSWSISTSQRDSETTVLRDRFVSDLDKLLRGSLRYFLRAVEHSNSC